MRCLLLLAILCVAAVAAHADTFSPANLCANPSFEEVAADGFPASWGNPGPVFSLDATVAHSGKNSLKFVNDDPNKYVLCSQAVKLEAGSFYEFKGWVKTQGVKGEDTGATFCMEWYGPKGYIGGAYPAGVKGDNDWTLVRGVTGRIPAEATQCSITCYLRKGMTGTAWFDDLELHRGIERPLSSALVSPAYRGWVFPGGPEEVHLRAQLALRDAALRPQDVAILAGLVDAGGNVVAKGRYQTLSPTSVEITIPALSLPAGQYTARVALVKRATNEEMARDEYPIVRRKDGEPMPHSYIDSHRRLIIDGKPFFPLGMYWSGISEKDLTEYADSPFNCLMPYGAPSTEQLDQAQKFGLKVIYTVKDIYYGTAGCPADIKTDADEKAFITQAVNGHKAHPALLGWYLNDELSAEMADRLDSHQTWVSELDPDHPTWVVLCTIDDIPKLTKSFDVIGTDPYPIPTPGPWRAGEWAISTREGTQGTRAMWMVPQVFNWGCYQTTDAERANSRPPTLEEMRSMAWQCICEGATGLIFYSWFDIQRDKLVPFSTQWGFCKQMGEEIKRYVPALLSTDPAPKVAVTGGGWLHALVRSYEGRTYIFAVNDGKDDGAATFTVPGSTGLVRVPDERRTLRRNADGAFADRFDKLAVHIYEIGQPGPRPAGAPGSARPGE